MNQNTGFAILGASQSQEEEDATIEEMAAKGQAKLQRKATSMASSYEAAKSRAVQNFQAVGFGPTRTANYQSGVQAAHYRAPDPGKWARNWTAKMRE